MKALIVVAALLSPAEVELQCNPVTVVTPKKCFTVMGEPLKKSWRCRVS